MRTPPQFCIKKKLIAVGLPVTRQPPLRSRRAIFPHRALREYSLPQQDQSDVSDHSAPCSLSPTLRFALVSGPSCPVSVSFAGFVSRLPLPPVNGSPVLRVLWADLTPNSSSVHLSFPSASLTSRQRGTGWASQVLQCFSSHMPRSWATPADPRQPHLLRLLCIGFCIFDSIAVCFVGLDEAVSSFRECGLSYGLCDALCTLQSFRSMIDSPPRRLQHSVWVVG